MSVIRVEIVSTTEVLYSGEASCVIASAINGEVGVLPKHTPFLTTLKAGEVRVQKADGSEESIFVSGGILEVQPDVVTVLSDIAVRASDLDEALALKAKEAAETALAQAQSDQNMATTESALAEAVAKLQVIENRRRRQR